MTIKSNTGGVSLSMSEIQTEFGGSNPIALNEYYAGGGLVPNGTLGYPNGPSGSAVAIPSSGQISINNFYGSAAEPDAYTLANHFWNNKQFYVRNSHSTESVSQLYAGTYVSRNQPGNRYTNPVSRTWYYSSMPSNSLTQFFTIVSVAVGQIANYGGITSTSASSGTVISNPGPLTLVGDGAQPTVVGNGYGLSVDVKVYSGNVSQLSFGSSSITSLSGGGNNGTWLSSYIIPGKWGFVSPVINFSTTSYLADLQAGDMWMMVYERGGDYSNMPIPPGVIPVDLNNSDPAFDYGDRLFQVDQWWYNGGGHQFYVNTSPYAAVLGFMNIGYNNLNDHTPRVAGILRRFY